MVSDKKGSSCADKVLGTWCIRDLQRECYYD